VPSARPFTFGKAAPRATAVDVDLAELQSAHPISPIHAQIFYNDEAKYDDKLRALPFSPTPLLTTSHPTPQPPLPLHHKPFRPVSRSQMLCLCLTCISCYELVNRCPDRPLYVDYAACTSADATAYVLSDGALLEIAGLEFQFFFDH
jgi:hypothetical protein